MKVELAVSHARFVASVRLDAVRRWLEQQNMGIAAAAAKAGFSGPDHFIRAFSRRFGVTPAAYRQIHGHQGIEGRGAAE